MRYDPDRLVKAEPADPGAYRALDLPSGDIPVLVVWALDGPSREAAFDVRRQVFVHEQGYTEEQEFDESEDVALHVLAHLVPTCATTPGASRNLGAARLLLDGSEDPPVAYVSRLSVLPFARRMGLGRAIVEFVLEGARAAGCVKARAGAQVTALEFWSRLGFHPTGEGYMDFHVPHEWAERRL